MSNLKSSPSSEQFWDQRYIGHNAHLQRFWTEECSSVNKMLNNNEFRAMLEFFGDLNGAHVLDLGCGEGYSSLSLAACGAHVTAIDISSIAVEQLNTFCQSRQIRNINAIQAEALDIEALGQFDFVVGSMILHHIEPFDAFAQVLAKTLKSGGKAFFYENNAFSDLLMWFRENIVGKLWISKGGDDEEFPLLPAEVDALRNYLQVKVIYPRMVFFQLLSQYILKNRLLKLTQKLDEFAFRFEFARKYSYRQYVLLEKPVISK